MMGKFKVNLIKKGIVGLIIISLGLVFLPDLKAMVEENAKATEEFKPKLSEISGISETQLKASEYVPGELIVKLKQDSSVDELKDLNAKYNVISCEKLFKETTDPKDTLAALKDKLSNLESKSHQGWYWQLDKNSKEYKDYIVKIEKEKQELKQQIQIQEEFLAKLEQRQKRAPEGVPTPNLKSTYLLKANAEASVSLMASDYAANSAVEYAEPNYITKIQMVPNDPLYVQQWAHKKTSAESAWGIERGNPNIIIAILDTGVDYNHEDLKANIWKDAQGNPGKDFVDINTRNYVKNGYILIPQEDYTQIDNDPFDCLGHGSHCAGIVGAAGNNETGVAGVCHNCKIMPVRIGFALQIKEKINRYYYRTSTVGSMENDDIANGIKYAVDNLADVISMSFGGKSNSSLIEQALNYAYSQGVVLVAAAGNENTNVKSYPAAYDQVIAVAATDSLGQKASFSNYGCWVDIASPGVNILSTIPANKYTQYDGTSMACPYVAGAAGLLLSKYPNETNEKIKYRIQSGADLFPVDYYPNQLGAGRINVYKSFTLALDTTPPLTPLVIDEGEWTRSAATLSASWSSSDPESGISEYQYAIGTSKGVTDVLDWVSTGTAASVIKTGLTLTNIETYYFSVKAKNGAGLWSGVGYSDGIKVKLDQDVSVAPVAPSNLAAIAKSSSQIDLTWDDNSNNETGFKVEKKFTYNIRGVGQFSFYLEIATVGVNVFRYTDSGLGKNTTYSYRVRAYNQAGNSGYTNIANAKTF